MNLSWKDELLLREMERFEARDRRQTGPRAPLPESDDSEAGQLIWWKGLADSRQFQITALLDKLHASERDVRRYSRAFHGAACIAALLGIALAISILERF